MSWLTRITAPEYSVSASTSASRDSISRWLVGSSRISRCGASMVASSSDSRAFCPPDRRADDGIGLIGHQAEAGQPRAQPGLLLGRAQALDVLQRRLVDVQLIHLMLGEIADAQFDGAVDPALACLKFARQQLGKRGFSFAIAAQKGDPVVLVDPQGQLAQHGRAAIADGGAFHVDDRRRQLFGLGEGEDRPSCASSRRGDRRQLLQHLHAAIAPARPWTPWP